MDDMPLSEIAVCVETADLEKRSNVTGPIWLDIDGVSFPSKNWTDFPVIVLGWWLSNLRPLVEGSVDKVECPFMDGPYSLEVSEKDNGSWLLNCFRTESSGNVYQTGGEVLPERLIESILNASEKVISRCET